MKYTYLTCIVMCTTFSSALCMESLIIEIPRPPSPCSAVPLPSPHSIGQLASLTSAKLYKHLAQQEIPGSPRAAQLDNLGKRHTALANSHKNAQWFEEQLESPEFVNNDAARDMLAEQLAIYEWEQQQIQEHIQKQEADEYS